MTISQVSPYTNSLTKRYFDFLLSLTLLFLLLPLFLLLLIIVALETEGPPFFNQKRTGKNGKSFNILKFRTMIKNAEKYKKYYKKFNESDGPVFKIKDDPRFTKLGKFLARCGLDELPQLINVIKGEMSLVGPRPLPKAEAKKIAKIYQYRHAIKPGMTSSWIVKGAHQMSFREWMHLDLEYVEKATFKKDLSIIFKTIQIVLGLLLRNSKNTLSNVTRKSLTN